MNIKIYAYVATALFLGAIPSCIIHSGMPPKRVIMPLGTIDETKKYDDEKAFSTTTIITLLRRCTPFVMPSTNWENIRQALEKKHSNTLELLIDRLTTMFTIENFEDQQTLRANLILHILTNAPLKNIYDITP